jgi:hypothetical protein
MLLLAVVIGGLGLPRGGHAQAPASAAPSAPASAAPSAPASPAPSAPASPAPSAPASAAPSAPASAAPSAPASAGVIQGLAGPQAWAAPLPAGVSCPAGNLIGKKKPLFWEYAYNPDRISDEIAAEDGDNWKSDVTVELTTAAGHVDFDLGAPTLVRGIALQGDNNDDYPIEISDDRKTWRPVWTPGPVDGAGMRFRASDTLSATGRYLRVGAAKGDQSYSIGEMQVFCQKPEKFPAEVTRKKGVVKDETAERNKKYANAKMEMALICFAAFFFVLVAPPKRKPAVPGDETASTAATETSHRLEDSWKFGAALCAAAYLRFVLELGGAEFGLKALQGVLGPVAILGVVIYMVIQNRNAERLRWPLALVGGALALVHSVSMAWTLRPSQAFTANLTLGLALAVGIACLGVLVWARRTGRPMALWFERTTLTAVALSAAFTWTNYGAFHGSRVIHFWDTFHYYAGSKYFAENRYTNLYYCVQWAEIDAGRQKVVEARKVRNLKTNLLEETDDIIAHPEVCRDVYTDARWKEFRSDVEYFRKNMGADWWDKMFKDHGYNASPVWNMFGARFSNMSPASDEQIRNIAMLDLFFYVSMFLAILWAFGLRAFALALVVLGVGYPWAYYWTGGAFARVAWLWDAVLGVCFLKKRWYFLGGAALMGAALDRAFPSMLFVGVGIAMVIQFVKHLRGRGETDPVPVDEGARFLGVRRAHWMVALGAVAALAIAVPMSAATSGGMKSWSEFWDNSQKHRKTPLTNHMGLPTLWTYHPAHVARKSKNDKMEDPFQGWKDKRQDLLRERAPFWALSVIAMVALIGFWSRRFREPWQLTAASTLFIVGLFELTCYYYNFVILLAPLAISRARHALVFIAMAFIGQYVQLRIGWFDEQYLWETVFVLVFMLYLFVDQAITGVPSDEASEPTPAEPARPSAPVLAEVVPTPSPPGSSVGE